MLIYLIFIVTDAYLSATAIIFLAPISAFDQVSHMVIHRASMRMKLSGRLANRINAAPPNSTLKRIRGRIGLTTLYNFSRPPARTNC
jgi:hypothetical protein